MREAGKLEFREFVGKVEFPRRHLALSMPCSLVWPMARGAAVLGRDGIRDKGLNSASGT